MKFIQFDAKTSIEEIRKRFFESIDNPNLPNEIKEKFMRNIFPFLFCPKNNGSRVLPRNCIFCECGHQSECHYPKNCYDAKCSHFQQNQRFQLFDTPVELDGKEVFNHLKGVN